MIMQFKASCNRGNGSVGFEHVTPAKVMWWLFVPRKVTSIFDHGVGTLASIHWLCLYQQIGSQALYHSQHVYIKGEDLHLKKGIERTPRKRVIFVQPLSLLVWMHYWNHNSLRLFTYQFFAFPLHSQACTVHTKQPHSLGGQVPNIFFLFTCLSKFGHQQFKCNLLILSK